MERVKYFAGMGMAFSGLIVGLSTMAAHPLLDVFILIGATALLLYSAIGLFQMPERDNSILRRK